MLQASCHCGSVQFEIPQPPDHLNQCHCSICRRYGTLWGYYPPDQVRIIGKPDATEVYCWGDQEIEFHRCRVCGCVAYWQPKDPTETRMGINARLLDPADIAGVPIKQSPGPP
jgi:hypothetical protein